jgi:hypothetical protein
VVLDRFEVRAPETPGRYLLVFDLVNEGQSWFSDKGADRLAIPVRIE